MPLLLIHVYTVAVKARLLASVKTFFVTALNCNAAVIIIHFIEIFVDASLTTPPSYQVCERDVASEMRQKPAEVLVWRRKEAAGVMEKLVIASLRNKCRQQDVGLLIPARWGEFGL